MNDQDQNKSQSHAAHLGTDDFDKTLQDAGDKPVMVDFYADWCGPCQIAAPIIDKLAGEYADKAVIAKVNVDEHNALAQKYGVMSIPTVVMFQKGEETDRQIGYAGEQGYVKMLDKALSS